MSALVFGRFVGVTLTESARVSLTITQHIAGTVTFNPVTSKVRHPVLTLEQMQCKADPDQEEQAEASGRLLKHSIQLQEKLT